MQGKDTEFLRRLAEKCIALSRATFDLTLAGRLRALADELRAKASEGDDEIDGEFQPATYGRNGSHTGKSGRN